MVIATLYLPLYHSYRTGTVALSCTMNFTGRQTWRVVILYLLCKRPEMQLSPRHRAAEPSANTTLRQPGWLVAFVTVASIAIKTSIVWSYKGHVPATLYNSATQDKLPSKKKQNEYVAEVHILYKHTPRNFTHRNGHQIIQCYTIHH